MLLQQGGWGPAGEAGGGSWPSAVGSESMLPGYGAGEATESLPAAQHISRNHMCIAAW